MYLEHLKFCVSSISMPSEPKDLWKKKLRNDGDNFYVLSPPNGWLIALLRPGEEPAEVTANVSRRRKIYDKATLILIHGRLSPRERKQTHTLKKIFSDIFRDFSTILRILLNIKFNVVKIYCIIKTSKERKYTYFIYIYNTIFRNWKIANRWRLNKILTAFFFNCI